jgi:hypothetical protein
MATITELSLFKLCVDECKLSKPEDFNMQALQDPSNPDLTQQQKMSKKALKLYHMAWSGITKYIRQTVQVGNRPIELPGLCIFIPIAIEAAEQPGKLTSKLLA